jgi:hypothetical protein
LDFYHARVVCNDSKTGRKQEGRQGCAATRLLMKNIKMDVKTSFSDVMSEVQKDCKTFLQE